MNATLLRWQSGLKAIFSGRRAQLSLSEAGNSFLVGTRSWEDAPRDRNRYDRAQVLADCLDAWRFNPLARRLVELTSEYAAGGGMVVGSQDPAVAEFLHVFWEEPLNHMDLRLREFSDELVRSGNLFVLLSTDLAGMSYLRVIPTAQIEHIVSRENDIEQELAFETYADTTGKTRRFDAWQAENDVPDEKGSFKPVVLHFVVNRPAGAQWGEPDLAPVLKWLSRYAAWLDDRVRLNRFRNAFLFVVKARFANEAARSSRQARLTANPPQPGSILVTDESEDWSVLSPRLEALDASTDGLAIKKMIAAGLGMPLHFLAEPESSTRTTAEAAGGPAYRRLEERQHLMEWIVARLLRVVLSRRAMFEPRLDPQAEISVYGGDISARDNSALASAGAQVWTLAQGLKQEGLISREELLRLVYRFLGEKLPENPGRSKTNRESSNLSAAYQAASDRDC